MKEEEKLNRKELFDLMLGKGKKPTPASPDCPATATEKPPEVVPSTPPENTVVPPEDTQVPTTPPKDTDVPPTEVLPSQVPPADTDTPQPHETEVLPTDTVAPVNTDTAQPVETNTSQPATVTVGPGTPTSTRVVHHNTPKPGENLTDTPAAAQPLPVSGVSENGNSFFGGTKAKILLGVAGAATGAFMWIVDRRNKAMSGKDRK